MKHYNILNNENRFVKTEIYKHSWGIILVLIAFVLRIGNHVLSPALTLNNINILVDKHLQ